MIGKEFKELFAKEAELNGFSKAFGGWYKESNECIVVLDLQKSNFNDSYLLNIKIYVQGIFGNRYQKTKELIKKDSGDVFRRHPSEFDDLFSFESNLNDTDRKNRLKDFFLIFLVPFTNESLTRRGIKELAGKKEILLLPAVEKQLM